MTGVSSERLHATSVAIGDNAILIMGRSGTGKSDLALRLIDRGAVLVSDDSTQLDRKGDSLLASAPATIKGRMEVYGVGIVDLPTREPLPVRLIISLDEPATRMPEWTETRTIAGCPIPVIAIDPREPSAPLKAEYALRRAMA